MIKVKMKELVAKVEAIKAFFPEKMHGESRYLVVKTLKLINDELEIFNEERKRLIVLHGTENEVGDIKVKPEKLKEFNESMNNFLETEVKLNCDPMSNSLIAEYDLSPFGQADLHWLFVD